MINLADLLDIGKGKIRVVVEIASWSYGVHAVRKHGRFVLTTNGGRVTTWRLTIG